MYRSHSSPFFSKPVDVCKVCGCTCPNCLSGISDGLDLHREIEELRSKLTKGTNQMTQMEREFVQSREFAEQEITKLQDELSKLRDRYDRLFDSHRKLQKLNHNLEDKLLTMVDKFDGDSSALQKDITVLNSKLLDAKVTICDLEEECERYRVDCNMAVQLLQCKPSNFVAHKLNTLPLDLQERVKSHLTQQEITDLENSCENPPEPKMIRVPMPTFPPTAMVYSVNKPATPPKPERSEAETVDTNLIAKVLSHPDPGRKKHRIFICSKCCSDRTFSEKGSQTTGHVDITSRRSSNDSPPARTSPNSGQFSPNSNYYFYPHYPGVHRPRLNSTETEI